MLQKGLYIHIPGLSRRDVSSYSSASRTTVVYRESSISRSAFSGGSQCFGAVLLLRSEAGAFAAGSVLRTLGKTMTC